MRSHVRSADCPIVNKACGVLAAVAIGLALPMCGMTIGALTGSLEPFLWSLASVVIIGLAAIAWSGLRYDLLRVNGTLTEAKITGASRIDLGPNDIGILNWYEIQYRYVDHKGTQHQGSTRPMRSIPSVAEAHTVRYDPENPGRSIWIK
jgi:hypothetical protein